MQRVAILCFLVAALALGACSNNEPIESVTSPPLYQADPGTITGAAIPQAIPPQAHAYGKTYGEWSAAFWQWLWSAPVAEHPGIDETGENIGYGQSGSVWFLAANFGGTTVRSATIPTGKALFINVAGWFFSPLIGDPPTEPELRAAAAAAVEATQNVFLEVDGVLVENIMDYRFASPEMFSFYLPEDNLLALFGFPLGEGTYYPAVSDGYFVMLPPLSAGQHTIRIHAEFPDPFGVSDVTVYLTVQNPNSQRGRGSAAARS